jgi:PAS domain S-box-containing protein
MLATPPAAARSAAAPLMPLEAYRLLVDGVTDYALFMLDPEGRIVSWNRGAEKVTGCDAVEMVGAPIARLYSPEDAAAGRPAQELSAAAAGGSFDGEGWRARKCGQLFWAQVVTTALRDERGELRGYAKMVRDLTAQRAVEQHLRAMDQRFHMLVDSVVDYAIFMLDPAGRVATWNAGARRLKGYSAQEILGQHFSVFYGAEDRAAGKPASMLEAAMRNGRHEDEGWRVRKDGSRFRVNVVVTPLRDAEGKLLGFAKVTRDLTAQREAEEGERRLEREQAARAIAEEAERRVRESEERYRALSRRLQAILEGIEDGITVQDRTGRMVFANSRAARLCGASSVDELLRTPSLDVVGRFEILDEQGQPLPAVDFPARRALQGNAPERPVVMQVRDRSTGRQSWSSVRATVVSGPDGGPDLVINLMHDVTESRRREVAEKTLAAATGALSSSLDLEPALSDFAAAVVPALADWCTIHVLEDGELRGVAVEHADPVRAAQARELQRHFPPNPKTDRGLWNVVRTGQAQLYEQISDDLLQRSAATDEHLALLRAAGMSSVILVPIHVRSRVVGTLTLVVSESSRRFDARDVSVAEELGRRAGVAIENARLYALAQEEARHAEEANRAKDEFLATVSHELRTPLNAIVGWSTLLKDRAKDPAVARPIEVIYRNAQAQVKIIDDILDVARIITGKMRIEPQPADLVAIARSALEVVGPSAAAKEIALELSVEADSCQLVADPERLQQVVWNLLSNAVKFTDPGGRISVRVGYEAAALQLSVSDTGRGIDPGFLPFVFERFRQADASITRRVGGVGLGLALVRHIDEQHGGRVTAVSDGPGKGSTFTVMLPVRAVLPPREERPSSPATSTAADDATISLAGVRVLVVDDEPDARDLIRVVLEDAGATVETAPSAFEASRTMGGFRPDVLVSDIGMPGEDGYTFMRRVRSLQGAEGGSVPSLALTAYAREEDRARARAAGYTGHLGKPVNPYTLAAMVARLAGRQAPG